MICVILMIKESTYPIAELIHIAKCSFSPQAIKLWNNLPLQITELNKRQGQSEAAVI